MCGSEAEHKSDIVQATPGPGIEAISGWIAQHRPDVMDVWESLLSEEGANNRRAQSILAVAFVGFEAGRAFEQAHPDAQRTPIQHRFEGRHMETPSAR